MTNLFTIKAHMVETDDSGLFHINLGNDTGYNILPTPFVYSDSGAFAVVEYLTGNATTVNPIFGSMYEAGLPLNEIHASADSRLYGLNQFKAVDENGGEIQQAKVHIMVVIWH